MQWAAFHQKKYPELKWLNSSQNAFKRTIIQGARAKKAGLKAGFPDLFLPCVRGIYAGLFVELKIKPNKPTPDQIIWIEYLNQAGYLAKVCYGYEESTKTIQDYLCL